MTRIRLVNVQVRLLSRRVNKANATNLHCEAFAFLPRVSVVDSSHCPTPPSVSLSEFVLASDCGESPRQPCRVCEAITASQLCFAKIFIDWRRIRVLERIAYSVLDRRGDGRFMGRLSWEGLDYDA